MPFDINLLHKNDRTSVEESNLKHIYAQRIVVTLEKYGVKIIDTKCTDYSYIYEIIFNKGVKYKSIIDEKIDLEYRLGCNVDIMRTSDNKSTLSIVAYFARPFWSLRDAFETQEYKNSKSELTIAAGLMAVGKPLLIDLKETPHILVTGCTGGGKSVFLDSVILSILFRAKPEDVELILIDTTIVDLSFYDGIKYISKEFKHRFIGNRANALDSLRWAEEEMNRRYKLFTEEKVRAIDSYNQKDVKPLTRIIIVIDEFYDLVKGENDDEDEDKEERNNKKEVNDMVSLLARKGRAAGIHLVIATQCEATGVITGSTKNNFPVQVSFSTTDTARFKSLSNRTKRKLNGCGDMEYVELGRNVPMYAQAPYVSESEVHKIVESIKAKEK